MAEQSEGGETTQTTQQINATPWQATEAEIAAAAATAQGQNGEGEGEGEDEGEGEGEGNAELVRDVVTQVLEGVIPSLQQPAARQQQQEPQYTQADYERMFNVFKPDEVLLQRLRHEDPKVAMEALVAIRDGLIRQSMTMAEARIQQLLDGLRQNEIGPISEYVSEARATALKNDFMTKHEDLQQYDTIVDAVSAQMEAGGATFRTKDDMFREIAKQSRAVIKKLLAVQKGGNGGGNAQTRSGGARMSTVSAGGHGGGGGGGRQQTSNLSKGVAEGLAVFE